MGSKQHTVIGSGTAPAKVLAEGLNDVLDDGDSVGLIWTGKPTEGQEAVFDYVLDNEVPFTLYYEDGQNPPKVFRNSEHGVVQKSRDPIGKALEDTDGSVLMLWDEDENPDLIGYVWDTVHPEGINILELTNGLTPITLEEEDEEVVEAKSRYEEADEDDEEEDDTRFTKDELEVMAAAAVKRYGARIGVEATTKKGIIEELFPDDEGEEYDGADEDGGEEPFSDYDEGVKLGQVLPEGTAHMDEDIEEVVNVIRDFLYKVARGQYN